MLFKASIYQLITCLNVSKACSPAFSPPLLTKASSFSRRSLILSSFSSESHTFKPNKKGLTLKCLFQGLKTLIFKVSA